MMSKKGIRSLAISSALLFAALGTAWSFTQTAFASETETAEAGTEAAGTTDFGTVVVGIDGAYPPYCFLNDDGEVDGFEVALVSEIAKRNGFTADFQVTGWDGMFAALDAGRLDTVGESITITEERKEKYVFSSSYVEASNRFIVKEGHEADISTFKDLEGKRIGVAAGQTAYEQLENIKKDYDVDFEIVPYNSSTNANDVSLGRLDASYMNPVAALETSRQGNLGLAVADVEAYSHDYCGYPFVNNTERGQELAKVFSDTLHELDDDGTLKELSETWFGTDITVVKDDL